MSMSMSMSMRGGRGGAIIVDHRRYGEPTTHVLRIRPSVVISAANPIDVDLRTIRNLGTTWGTAWDIFDIEMIECVECVVVSAVSVGGGEAIF